MVKEYENPLSKKVNLRMFETGKLIRAGIIVAALGAAGWWAADKGFIGGGQAENAPVAGSGTTGRAGGQSN